jgi:hypothetical protein
MCIDTLVTYESLEIILVGKSRREWRIFVVKVFRNCIS